MKSPQKHAKTREAPSASHFPKGDGRLVPDLEISGLERLDMFSD
jgi:hypothetical protein